MTGRRVQREHFAHVLDAHHYLGSPSRGWMWRDHNGLLVFAAPTSRRLPAHWLDLIRWCLYPTASGTMQWAAVSRWLREHCPEVTTIVSYSDPSQGHTGALYRACNWLWAPTWHRLRPPPTGNGEWKGGGTQAVKDRWVFPLQRDPERERLLAVEDESLMRRISWASYTEPRWRRRRRTGGGGDYARWRRLQAGEPEDAS